MVKKIAILYTTIESQEKAEALTKLAISSKLAGCANITLGGKSIYFWQDNLEESEECYILFKTSLELVQDLKKFIIENHEYDTPSILIWECETSDDFYKYIGRILNL